MTGPFLYVLPIEPIAERYSLQWWHRWQKELNELKVPFIYAGVGEKEMKKPLDGDVGKGEFLDPKYTHRFKAEQLAEFVRLCSDNIRDGDWVLLHDAWNPQVEALAYIRDTVGPRFKIAGLLHAGTWDENDYLSQKGLGRWAAACEEGWLEALDLVFVATDYHKRLILSKRVVKDPEKIKVTGFPLYREDFGSVTARPLPWGLRRQIVTFPHRLAPEKQPLEFADIEARYRKRYGFDGSDWFCTKHVCKTKEAYYDLLNASRVVVSTALQETWGIAMLEGMLLGAAPVAPNRLSYPETMPSAGLYNDLDEAVDMVHARLWADTPKPSWFAQGNAWRIAIRKIMHEMELP